MQINLNGATSFKGSKLERYSSILPILGKGAEAVIDNLKGRGRASWKIVQANIQLVNGAKSSQQKEYFTLLDQEIDLDEDYYTKEDFTSLVCGVMFRLGISPFEGRIGSKCEEEMFKLFLWEDVYSVPESEGEKPVFIGYRPICRLKA